MQWIAATLAVLLLIVVVGRGARWLLSRASANHGAALQRGLWRVAPDANIRAVGVLNRVHLLYERGRSVTLLESLDESDFEQRVGVLNDSSSRGGLLRSLPHSSHGGGTAKVARA